jgi:hypothetical protein
VQVPAARFAPPDEALASARAVVALRPGATLFLGVDGCGASGKSTLAARLAAALDGAEVIAVDDFSSPRLAEWDWNRFSDQVVEPLRSGGAARYQRWDWDRDEGAEWHDVPPGRPIIVEGVSSTRREMKLPWAWTAWVEAPRVVRLDRARARDGAARMPLWLNSWMPSEDAYVAREQPQTRVDIVVSGIIDAVRVHADDGGLVAVVGDRVAGRLRPDGRVDLAPGFEGHGVESVLLASADRCQQ